MRAPSINISSVSIRGSADSSSIIQTACSNALMPVLLTALIMPRAFVCLCLQRWGISHSTCFKASNVMPLYWGLTACVVPAISLPDRHSTAPSPGADILWADGVTSLAGLHLNRTSSPPVCLTAQLQEVRNPLRSERWGLTGRGEILVVSKDEGMQNTVVSVCVCANWHWTWMICASKHWVSPLSWSPNYMYVTLTDKVISVFYTFWANLSNAVSMQWEPHEWTCHMMS